MLTICLDESGVFEDDNYNKPLIIGGFIYVGEDVKEEEERLRDFYINACKDIEYKLTIKNGKNISIPYPNGIHSTDNKGSIGYDINRLLSEKVLAYIKKSGKYYLTAMIKSKDMKESFSEVVNYDTDGATVTSILDFNKGANLYERMATKFLYNNIFYNPLIKKENEKVNLNLATRTISVEEGSELYNELMKLNYNKKKNDNGTYRFYVTNSNTFRAALSTKIYESDVNKNIDYTLNVESINYKQEGTTPFLYLADNVCEIIKHEVKSIKGTFDTMTLVEIMKDKTGQEFMCFIHDDIDLIWTKLIKKLENKDLIGTLEMIADIRNSLSYHKNLYLDFWVEKISQEIIEIFNKNNIDSYLAKLDYYFGKDTSDYEKGLLIAEGLLKIVESNKPRNEEVIKYKINEKIALAHNHRGSISKALEYFEKCESLKTKGISALDYLNTVNRKTVSITNACAFERAIEDLTEQLPKYVKIKEAYLDIAADMGLESEEAYIVREEGKILSGIGQNLSFLRRYDEAEESFYNALEIFTGKVDRAVTKSYLMHMYIEAKNREKYEELISEVLGTNDITEQLNILFENPKRVDRYTLYIYIKALNELYGDIVDKELVEKAIKLLGFIINDSGFNQHPKELIVKHLALLSYKKELKSDAEKLIKEHLNTIKDSEFTINIITEKANIDLLELKKSKIHVNNKVEIEKLDREIKKHIDVIKELIKKEALAQEVFSNLLSVESTNVSQCLEVLNERLTYMYN